MAHGTIRKQSRELIAKKAVLGGGDIRKNFQMLYLLINNDIYQYFRSGTKDDRDAEELTTDTCIALGRNIRRLQPHPVTESYWDAVCAWWRTVAKSILLNFRKRTRRHLEFLDRYREHTELTQGAPSPEDVLIADQQRRNAQRITEDHVAAMPPEKRAIFDDHRAGMSHVDIAVKYGKNATTVRKVISREIRALRKKITSYQGGGQ